MAQAPVAYEEAAETPRGEVDEHGVEELDLYVENTSELYKQKQAILANLGRQIDKGTYDHEKAAKLWGYWVDEGAKRYAKEFDGVRFNKATRDALASRLARRYYEEALIERGKGGMHEAQHAANWVHHKDGTWRYDVYVAEPVGERWRLRYDYRGNEIFLGYYSTLGTAKHVAEIHKKEDASAHEAPAAYEAQHAYRYADVSFDYLEDAKKFASLLEKKYPRVAVDVGGTQHGGVVTTDATFEQIVAMLSKHAWRGSYRLSSNARKMDLAAETKEDCSHMHPPEVPSLPCATETSGEICVVDIAPEGFRSYTTSAFRSVRSALAAARKHKRAWQKEHPDLVKHIVIVHVPSTSMTVEHWVVGHVVHEARDVVPAADSTFATLRRDAPPQDVVKRWGTVDSPRKIYEICRSLQQETGECFVVIGIDVQGQVIPADGKPGVLIARGQQDRVNVEPDDVAQAIAVMKPAGYVLVHQHPSGRATPSKADLALTASIRKVVKTSTYVDHVVVGASEYHSMRDGKNYKV